MALTGIQILKMLPKKNCRECDVPTCLAFAMKVAAGQADIAACPYVSDEVKEKIGEASAPPIRTIALGSGEGTFEMGGEHHAGIMELPHDAQDMGAKSHWLSYVTVEDVDAMLEKAQELGASVLCPPTDIPETGRFAVIQDPQGGMLSLFTYAESMLGGD